ncbi:MAG: uracil-DNA glycosylase, partial [Rhabdochlamydiaceae bacterium]
MNLFSEPKVAEFEILISEALSCTKCARMCDSQKVISYANGSVASPVMFIGEAPGRLGADDTGIPFHGDRAGENFEDFLKFAGIERREIYITNAILCNPKDASGNNGTPSEQEVLNCSGYLKRQIDLLDPKIIVTLGATALGALRNVEGHRLSLSTNVRTAITWYDRTLIPLYHPGQRALLHR